MIAAHPEHYTVATEVADVSGGETREETLAERGGVSVEEVRVLQAAGQQALSLDTPRYTEGDSEFSDPGCLVDVLEETATDQSDAVFEEHALQEGVSREFAALSEQQRRVLSLRFGREETDRPLIRREIGDQLRLSVERVRKIEKAALGKLAKVLEQMG